VLRIWIRINFGWIRIGKKRRKIEISFKGDGTSVVTVGGVGDAYILVFIRNAANFVHISSNANANDVEIKKKFKIFDSAPGYKISCY
jgi:hypothetical protein